ncbi:hypothetical protein GPECTOR_61g842 [Gonium pectorale]|uniref:Uncharacterized protein n=1 Tax=Gonium pectorale TaxID=33097 RepID=A0A150G4S7_GONPE|nr:hypothetical protein GPECTOR_61g842 [Gonium pectorale]|eukprot:KXZ44889.1 hypothetical protein GPECTOR_61g842 [Gonium pectorale]
MTTEQKYKLAHAMNMCFLTSSGHAGYKCSSRMGHRECSTNMDDRAFNSYNTFFANIHSLCLYVSNRNFERHTSQLLNKLYQGAGAAQGLLADMAQGLAAHQAEQRLLQDGLAKMRDEQRVIAAGMREGLQQLGAVQLQAAAIELQVNRTLAMEEELAARQGRLLSRMGDLEALEAQHAAAAGQQWRAVLEAASRVEERQAAHGALQAALAEKSAQLLAHSGQLQGAMESVLAAQRRTSDLLGRVLGGHWTLKDLAFYLAAGALATLLTGPVGLQSARLPLLALLFLTAFCERLLRQYVHSWVPLLGETMPL